MKCGERRRDKKTWQQKLSVPFRLGMRQFGLFFRGRTAQCWGWWLPSSAWRNPFEKEATMNLSTVTPSLKFVAPKKRKNHVYREECLFLPALSCQYWAKAFPAWPRLLPPCTGAQQSPDAGSGCKGGENPPPPRRASPLLAAHDAGASSAKACSAQQCFPCSATAVLSTKVAWAGPDHRGHQLKHVHVTGRIIEP